MGRPALAQPAREAAASELGLGYRLRSSLEIGETLYSNLELLNEYRVGGLTVPPETEEAVRSCLSSHGAVSLKALLTAVRGLARDDVFTMLVEGRVHAELQGARLLEPAEAMLALTPERVRAYRLFEEAMPVTAIGSLTTATLTGGQRVLWNGVTWSILNAGHEYVTLRCDDGRLQDVARKEFQRLMGAGRLVDVPSAADHALGAAVRDRLRLSTEEDLRVAQERHRLLEAVAAGEPSRWARERGGSGRCGAGRRTPNEPTASHSSAYSPRPGGAATGRLAFPGRRGSCSRRCARSTT